MEGNAAGMVSAAEGRQLPKYEAVADALGERVRTLGAHDPLPTERELMTEFEVSRDTVRKAIQRLAARGLVYNIHGSGTYVADPAMIAKTLRLTSFSEDMRERGLDPSSRVLAAERLPADENVARELGLEPGAPVHYLRRLRLAGGTPMAIESAYLTIEAAGLDGLDPQGSVYDQLAARGSRIERATQTISAVNLDRNQAHILDQPIGAAAIRVDRTGYTDRGRAVERTETLFRGDRYSFELVVSREL